MQSTSSKMPGWDEAQAGIKIAGRNINTLRYAGNTRLMAEGEEELKNLLIKVKEENENVHLKLSIKKANIMASGLITSWQTNSETKGKVTDYFWGSQKSLQMMPTAMKLKQACSLEEKI